MNHTVGSARVRVSWWVWAWLAIGLLRSLWVVWHVPMAGYANQYDMARTSACLGLWPDNAPGRIDAPHRQAPLTLYRYGGATGEACYPGTDVVLAAIAMGLDRLTEVLRGSDARDFDLRQAGTLKWMLLLAIAGLFDRRLRSAPRWRLAHAIIFGLILADPFNALYFNTLYTESGALLAAYAAFAFLCHFALGGPTRLWPSLGFVLALTALGGSRVQHLALPLALVPFALYGLWRNRQPWRLAGAIWMTAALSVLAVQIIHQSNHPGIASANRINSLFGAVLPAAENMEALAVRLGLPAHCATLAYVTWYSPRGRDPAGECPQAFTLPRWRLATVLATEPRAMAVLLGYALTATTAWRLPYLGEVAKRNGARVVQPSLAEFIAPRGFLLQVVLWAVPLLLALAAAWRLVWRRQPDNAAADTLLTALAAVIAVTWATALLGDGFSEITRHLHLAQNAAVAAWVAGAGIAVSAVRRGDRGIAAQPLIALGLALLLGGVWLRMPLVQGLIDQPANMLAPVSGDEVETANRGESIQISGWALSPVEVERVEAVVDKGPAQPLVLSNSTVLDAFFPLGNGQGHAVHFEGSVSVDAEKAGSMLRLFAIDRQGGRIRIESMQLTPPDDGTIIGDNR